MTMFDDLRMGDCFQVPGKKTIYTKTHTYYMNGDPNALVNACGDLLGDGRILPTWFMSDFPVKLVVRPWRKIASEHARRILLYLGYSEHVCDEMEENGQRVGTSIDDLSYTFTHAELQGPNDRRWRITSFRGEWYVRDID